MTARVTPGSEARNPRLNGWRVIAAGALMAGLLVTAVRSSDLPTIANPVAPVGNDPWVMQKDGLYYYCYSSHGAIWVKSDPQLERVVQFPGKKVWIPEPGGPYSRHLWAPELHYLNGKWYIYFAADDGANRNHRMCVLEGRTQDPSGTFEFKGQLAAEPDKWAIDGSVLVHQGRLYFIWSGWQGDTNGQQDVFIARMASPTALTGPRVLISSPEYEWEKKNRPLINEGPTALYNGDRVFIVYSASGSWANDYCLGLLTLTGSDPLQRSSWKKRETPVLSGTRTVISPGHASFTKSPDGTEDWIVYHAARQADAGWDRDTRMQPFQWGADGSPVFGQPIPAGVEIAAPSRSKPRSK